jgi:hypothetical protein
MSLDVHRGEMPSGFRSTSPGRCLRRRVLITKSERRRRAGAARRCVARLICIARPAVRRRRQLAPRAQRRRGNAGGEVHLMRMPAEENLRGRAGAGFRSTASSHSSASAIFSSCRSATADRGPRRAIVVAPTRRDSRAATCRSRCGVETFCGRAKEPAAVAGVLASLFSGRTSVRMRAAMQQRARAMSLISRARHERLTAPHARPARH